MSSKNFKEKKKRGMDGQKKVCLKGVLKMLMIDMFQCFKLHVIFLQYQAIIFQYQ